MELVLASNVPLLVSQPTTTDPPKTNRPGLPPLLVPVLTPLPTSPVSVLHFQFIYVYSPSSCSRPPPCQSSVSNIEWPLFCCCRMFCRTVWREKAVGPIWSWPIQHVQLAEKNNGVLKRSQAALTTANRTAHTEQTRVTEFVRLSDDR